jgi:predicted small metal-binding protein
MKKFSCGDVVPGCTAQFEGATDDEILAQIATHARDAHGLAKVEPALVDAVRAKIVDVESA